MYFSASKIFQEKVTNVVDIVLESASMATIKGEFMPGNQVKDWTMYEALRKEGFSKTEAARITNSNVKKRKTRNKRKAK